MVNIAFLDYRHGKNFRGSWREHVGGATMKAAHDYMMQEVDVKEAGYAYIYVSNENATLVEFYVDDVVITHTPSNIIQYNEYYPFGMQTANSWTRENTTGNSFLYNEGSELNTTSGYYDLPYRTYDPVLGRMNGVDPLASKYASLTPYNYSNNDPVFYTDPSGAEYGVPEWLTRRLDQLPHIDGGGGSDGYQGMSALDRSFGSMKLIVKRIDWYTNGIIDDEHFIDSEYSFEMQYQQGLLQEGTGVKPWPIDIWDKDESTVVNGLLKHMYYYGHNSDKPYHLRDIVKNAVEPVPFWKAIFPGSSASNSTGGKKVEIFGARVQWYVGIAGAFTTDGWKTSPANKISSMQAFSREGKSFVDGTPATIYTIVMFGGNGRDQLIYLNFLDKDAWNKTYNYLNK